MIRSSAATAVVLGAGVSGLTTAVSLARHGWQVTVAAAGFGRETVSTVAGALWEWPPSVCGRHHNETLLEQSKYWAMASYRQFQHFARFPRRTGVYLRSAASRMSARMTARSTATQHISLECR